jgi:hypothetical protein
VRSDVSDFSLLLSAFNLSVTSTRYFRFGGSVDHFPHPEADWKGFLSAVEQHNATTGQTWNPLSQQMRDWVNVPALKAAYKGGACCVLN